MGDGQTQVVGVEILACGPVVEETLFQSPQPVDGLVLRERERDPGSPCIPRPDRREILLKSLLSVDRLLQGGCSAFFRGNPAVNGFLRKSSLIQGHRAQGNSGFDAKGQGPLRRINSHPSARAINNR